MSLEPVPEGGRLQQVDALRGFALFGVVLGNVVWIGYEALPSAQAAALPSAGLDRIVRYAVQFLIEWKFYTLFAFLFGVGFGLQLIRAESSGARFLPLYARRLGVLFLLGALHACLIWHGDVLDVYAVLGFLLVAFRRLATRTLLVTGLVLAVAVPAFEEMGPDLRRTRALNDSAVRLAADAREDDARRELRTRDLTEGPHPWRTLAEENVRLAIGFWGSRFSRQFLPAVLGKFLLGFYVGRLRILEDVSTHRRWLWRLLWGGLLLGAPSTILWVGSRVLVDVGELAISSPWAAAAHVPRHVGILGLSGFYLAAVVLLFERPRLRSRLAWLAPVGRLALTNYLGHSLAMAFLFYGFGLGLLGRVGAATCVALALGLFGTLALFSQFWLMAFRFGPTEWLWRFLTYGRLQPMRRRV